MADRHRGMTLLELIVATALLSAVVAAVGIVLRTGHEAAKAQSADTEVITGAHAVLRHIARCIRQAQAVVAISEPDNTSGTLSLLMPSGETQVWAHNAESHQVLFGAGGENQLLAEGIAELTFTGYESDGITISSAPDEIHSIKSIVRFQLPRQANGSRALSCFVWVRSW